MSNFHFDYNDIHKQVAIADLTDEQIQELFTLLQTKRSAKPQLTKEEKAFSNVAESIEVMPMKRIWILLSALIVALLSLSSTVQETVDRDISAKTVERHSEIPTAPLPFVPSCLLVNGLSLSS